jgi:DNA polymerase delta subunit 4
MKQVKLDFSSMKRNASATASAKDKIIGKVGVEPASPAILKESPSSKQQVENKEVVVNQTEPSETTSLLYTSSVAERPSKRTRTSAPISTGTKTKAINIDDSSSSEDEPEEPVDLDVLERSGKLNRHFGEVRAKMGGMPPVHGEENRRSDDILRVFDLWVACLLRCCCSVDLIPNDAGPMNMVPALG